MQMKAEIHPSLGRLAFLLGTWTGQGRGEYPTIESFTYYETVSFEHYGKPFLAYQQRTQDADGAPLHAEAGYLRPVDESSVELVIAQPTGIAEIYSGTQDGTRLELASLWVGRSPTAKRVDRVGRTVEVSDNALTYELFMASVGQPYQWQLGATLHRIS